MSKWSEIKERVKSKEMIDIIKHYPMGEKGVKIQHGDTESVGEVHGVNMQYSAILGCNGAWYAPEKHNSKPILLPLNKLSDEQLLNVGYCMYDSKYNQKFLRLNAKDWLRDCLTLKKSNTQKVLRYLYSIFADVHGLIQEGKDIDCTTLKDK